MKPEEFYDRLADLGFPLTDRQKEQYERYFELLVEWNEKINLTAITDKDEVYLKHFYDSIAPILQGLIENKPIRLLDIGAGAGFPAQANAVVRHGAYVCGQSHGAETCGKRSK